MIVRLREDLPTREGFRARPYEQDWESPNHSNSRKAYSISERFLSLLS